MGRTEFDEPLEVIVKPQTDADRRRLDELAEERGVIDAGTTRVSEQPLYQPNFTNEEKSDSLSS
jgi:hypothetical protein